MLSESFAASQICSRHQQIGSYAFLLLGIAIVLLGSPAAIDRDHAL